MSILSTTIPLTGTTLAARLPSLVEEGAVLGFQHGATLALVWREPFGLPDGQALVGLTAPNLSRLGSTRVPVIVYDAIPNRSVVALARLQRALAVPLPGKPAIGARGEANSPWVFDLVTQVRLAEACGADTRHAPAGPPRIAVEAMAALVRTPDA